MDNNLRKEMEKWAEIAASVGVPTPYQSLLNELAYGNIEEEK